VTCGGGERPRPLQRPPLGVQLLDEQLAWSQLARADERLDLVGWHRDESRLAHPMACRTRTSEPSQYGRVRGRPKRAPETQDSLVQHSENLVRQCCLGR